MEPFKDKRVRQAMALLVNRQALVDGLLDTKSDPGNDSPFAPVFPSTDQDVPQREQDVRKAKELLAAAGMEDGFKVQLSGWNGFEMPDLAQLIQQDVRQAGITIDLSITDAATYYGDATFGNSRWLDSPMGITEYGHRGVPNVLLGAPLLSKGTWNGAHFKNPQYDRPGQGLHGGGRPRRPAALREADPGAAARRDADPLHVLLLLPHGRRRATSPASTSRRWATTT